MCDDYFDSDNAGDGDNDDCTDDDAFDEGFDQDDEITDDEEEDCEDSDNEDTYISESAEDEMLPAFDAADTIILGSMIAGNAYMDAVDRANRLKLLNSKSNK